MVSPLVFCVPEIFTEFRCSPSNFWLGEHCAVFNFSFKNRKADLEFYKSGEISLKLYVLNDYNESVVREIEENEFSIKEAVKEAISFLSF